jgi:uncharacterized protein (DUF488 family)
MGRLLTFGHGTASPQDLVGLLSTAGVGQVVDVRRFPGSRRNPGLSSEELASTFPASGIGYHWEPRLGGRRRLPPGDEALDDWWRVTSFRAYAAHMRSEEFAAGMGDLLGRVAGVDTAIMCSESLWWRCHRRLVSDAAVLLHDVPVHHLGHDGRLTLHEPAEAAVVRAGELFYPAEA